MVGDRLRRAGRALQNIGGFLLARGRYGPAVTETLPDGTQRVVRAEIVEPKGVLWSKTVLFCLVTIFFAVANANGWNLWFTEEQAREVIGMISAGAGAGAIVSRIIAWMPTRGPTGPGAPPPARNS